MGVFCIRATCRGSLFPEEAKEERGEEPRLFLRNLPSLFALGFVWETSLGFALEGVITKGAELFFLFAVC